MHMNEHGITLQRGPHAGRLLRASRYYGLGNRPESVWHSHYTHAIYSDAGADPGTPVNRFPENGTGVATVAELSDGRIYYNSRVHWQERPKNTRRRAAWSHDGGETWTDYRIVDVLADGQQHRSYGLPWAVSYACRSRGTTFSSFPISIRRKPTRTRHGLGQLRRWSILAGQNFGIRRSFRLLFPQRRTPRHGERRLDLPELRK
jgi:hypothetical protein